MRKGAMAGSGTASGQRIGVVAETYGRALLSLALKANAVERVESEIADVGELVRRNEGLGRLMEHRTLDRKRRGESIRKIFGGVVSDLMLRFLLVLNDRNRLDEIGGIAAAFSNLAKKHRGEVDAELTTARPLSGSQMQMVAERLSASIGKKAIVHPRIDPSIIGGLKVRLGDRLIDASVSTQLRRLAGRLSERGQMMARGGGQSAISD
jgi:ATP synthase F1 delta subunit